MVDADLSVRIGDVELANPVMPGSGTFSEVMEQVIDFNRLGGIDPTQAPYMAKSLALSIRAHGRTHQSELNFRKGDFAYTGELSFLRGRILTLAAAAMFLIVLASIGAISKKRVLEAEYESLKRQVTALSVPCR